MTALLTLLYVLLVPLPQSTGNPELDLALEYAGRLTAGTLSEADRTWAAKALDAFQNVLRAEPENRTALHGLATTYQKLNDFSKAREYFLRSAALKLSSAAAYYDVAAVDWLFVYDRKNQGTTMEQQTRIEEGLRYLDLALALQPDFDDAMTYKNLLLRERARLAFNPDEKARFVAEADEWFNRALDARKRRAAQTPRPAGAIPVPPPPPDPGGTRLRLNRPQQELYRPELVYPARRVRPDCKVQSSSMSSSTKAARWNRSVRFRDIPCS